jgi:hypothetical protein
MPTMEYNKLLSWLMVTTLQDSTMHRVRLEDIKKL